ncbi:type VI secretion system protein ImpA [Novosphingobium sp. CF614]|uniref:type VI secretion system protein TssA n=1 Tax=Novosphingobium sp. CF614 TaxID=1884364 RepID=UPI0008E35867|nr:type VI secretion system ImpA family N-terminal domain-containing protein [Novosphingobium sp. CF614]SFF95235.1 type VI secretion system protein ImpA [Novosphingobium sp. CF614]
MLIDEERRQAILAPIDNSVGIDGREDEGAAGNLLREIRSQRKAIVRLEQTAAMTDDDLVLPDGAWDWEALAENSIEYLSDHGKDLEPMTVLIEAAARHDGLGDLAAAMALLADLVEAYWDQGLYPAEDEDGVETRFQPLSGLSGGSTDKDGALIQPVRKLVIARTGGGDLRHLDKIRADAAMTASQGLSGDQKSARIEEASELYREIEAHARHLPGEVLTRAAALAGAAEQGWRRAIGFISERTKPQFPGASRLTDELRAMREWLEGMAPTVAAAAEAPGDELASPGEPGAAAPAAAGGGFVAGKITRREDALKAIGAAADYFQLNEPLSPLGVTLREVDRRARMSLHDLLSELIPDDSARRDFYWRSGIKPPAEDDNNNGGY